MKTVQGVGWLWIIYAFLPLFSILKIAPFIIDLIVIKKIMLCNYSSKLSDCVEIISLIILVVKYVFFNWAVVTVELDVAGKSGKISYC